MAVARPMCAPQIDPRTFSDADRAGLAATLSRVTSTHAQETMHVITPWNEDALGFDRDARRGLRQQVERRP
jgi:hypothetical protein